MINASEKLTNLQLELLKLFRYQLNENQLQEVKVLLSRYFADRASDEMDKLWDKNNWSDETMEQWLSEQVRSTTK
jgi:hypothetical protein